MNKFKRRDKKQELKWEALPTVTLLIAAHNEEKVIAEKLKNSLALDYPKDKLQILVAADYCTDTTVPIVKSYQDKGVALYEVTEHLGKVNALNLSIKEAIGEFVVFSDANSMYEPNAIIKLIQHFTDEKIGVVCGNLVLANPQCKDVGAGEGLYWRYEKWIKKQESKLNSLIGANGSIYAIRKKFYIPPELGICDDFTIPILIHKKGYKVTYEPEAISHEETNETTSQAFHRKVRIIIQELVTLKIYWKVIKPFSGMFGFQMVSHKLLRWVAPFWMIPIFILNLFILNSFIGIVLLVCQIIFYSASFVGFLLDKNGKPSGKLRIPFYFCMMNLASLIAFIKFFMGKTQPKWKVAR